MDQQGGMFGKSSIAPRQLPFGANAGQGMGKSPLQLPNENRVPMTGPPQGGGMSAPPMGGMIQKGPQNQPPMGMGQMPTQRPEMGSMPIGGQGMGMNPQMFQQLIQQIMQQRQNQEPVPSQQNQLQQVPGASSMMPSANRNVMQGGMNQAPQDPRFQNFR